ncbi:MAG TPA: tetratricopeptide repeat protein [Pseudomonadota bacterium]|nr:tetratricopeptide repeat protein [Pseudomonadota bacterium]
MRLVLRFPAPWEVSEASENTAIAIRPGDGQPEASMHLGRLLIRPDEPRAFFEQTVRSQLPPGTQVKIGQRLDRQTVDGWPLHLIEAAVCDAHGAVLEQRLCAFFTFLEHLAVAVVRVSNPTRLPALAPEILAILDSGRPDWRGEPLSLADVWDLEPKPKAKPRIMNSTPSVRNDDALLEKLAEVEAALAANPTAADELQRGSILLDLKRPSDALKAFQAALQLQPDLILAHYFAGVALGELAQTAEAIAQWEAVLKLAPQHADALYNIAQARFRQGQFESALLGFAAVRELDPGDFQSFRKLIQCLYALGRYDDGLAARVAFRAQWLQTSDPRVRLMAEYVFDQFSAGALRVHALETLQPRDPAFYAVLSFRAVDASDRPLPVMVVVETSDKAKQAGTPFVLGVVSGSKFRTIGAAQQLPAYPELKQTVIQLLVEALQK